MAWRSRGCRSHSRPGISRERTERANLGYVDPATLDLDALKGREDEGILVVPKAGETLFRVKGA